jgi:maltose O-acetyltransferase
MFLPNTNLKRLLYKLRGTKLGKHVNISNMVFLEDIYPELIHIGNNVHIGPKVAIFTHDSSYGCISPGKPMKIGKVIICDNVYIGGCAIILPGVIIGDHSIIGAGAIVTKDIPSRSVTVGSPARVICTVDEWIKKKGKNE